MAVGRRPMFPLKPSNRSFQSCVIPSALRLTRRTSPSADSVGNVNIRRTQVEVVADVFQTGRVNRSVSLLVAVVFVATACGGAATDLSGEVEPIAGAVTTVSDASPTTTRSTATTGPSAAEPNPPPSGVDGPAAPDFSLVLSDGSTFTLSEGSKPVYMVFWAEW